jgi:hypothetical protein
MSKTNVKEVTKLEDYKFTVFQKIDNAYPMGVRLSDVHEVVIKIMKDLNKYKIGGFFGAKLSGEQKKELCVSIVIIVIHKKGLPTAVQCYDGDAVKELVENIYIRGYHKNK